MTYLLYPIFFPPYLLSATRTLTYLLYPIFFPPYLLSATCTLTYLLYPIFFPPLPSFSHLHFDLSLVSNLLSTLTFFQPLALWLISCIQSSFHHYLLSATWTLTYLLYPIFFPPLPSFSHSHFDLISCIQSSFKHYLLSATRTLTYLLYPIFFPLLPSFSHSHFDLSLVSNLLSTITFFQPLALWLISCIQSSFPLLPSFSHLHFDLSLVSNLLSTLTFFQPLALWLISCIQSSFHPYLLSVTRTLTYLLYPIFFPPLPSFSHSHFDLSLLSNLLSTITFFQPLALWLISCIQSSFDSYLLSATCTLTYLLYPIFFSLLPSFSHLHFDLSLVSNLLFTLTFFQPLALWLISCIQSSFYPNLLSATRTLTYLLYPIFFPPLPSFSHSHFDLSLLSNLLFTLTVFQPHALWLISCIQSSFHSYLLSATRTLTYLFYPTFFSLLPSFSHLHFDLSLVSNLLFTLTFFQATCTLTYLLYPIFFSLIPSFSHSHFDLSLVSNLLSTITFFQPLVLWLISCIQSFIHHYLLSATGTLTYLLYPIFFHLLPSFSHSHFDLSLVSNLLFILTFFQPLALWLISCIQSSFHPYLLSATRTLTYLLYTIFDPPLPSFSHPHFDLSLVYNLLSTITFFQPLALWLISCIQSFIHHYLLSATHTLTYLLYPIFFHLLPSFSHLHFDLSLVSNLLSTLTFFQPLALWLISCIQSSFHSYLLSATRTLT